MIAVSLREQQSEAAFSLYTAIFLKQAQLYWMITSPVNFTFNVEKKIIEK